MSQQKSIYEIIQLEANDQSRTIDLTGGVIGFEYYEDIFSPTITAKIKIVNSGNVIAPSNDKDPNKQSIYHGLPLRGGERISLKIAGNSKSNPGLDFSKKSDDYFYVSSITDVISETNRESFTLHLTSREAITNETARVYRKYSSTISNSVEKILKDVLKTNKFKSKNIEKTAHNYGFIGNMRKPFTILIWLASKGVPVSSGDASAGFFFYQTVDGFQFRSIDGLIGQPIRKDKNGEEIVYTYSEAINSYGTNDKKINNDRKILNYFTNKNQNLIEKLRLGTYSSDQMFFNPLDFSFSKKSEITSKNNFNKIDNLGSQKIKLPKVSQNSTKSLTDVPTRIMTSVLDIGTMEKNASDKQNYDPKFHQSQSLMRYNTLLTQTINIIVPSNTNLRAGDVIECNFPKISQSDKKEFDREQSGRYLIKELCHYFDTEKSYTSMKLIRDTFGIK